MTQEPRTGRKGLKLVPGNVERLEAGQPRDVDRNHLNRVAVDAQGGEVGQCQNRLREAGQEVERQLQIAWKEAREGDERRVRVRMRGGRGIRSMATEKKNK